MPAAREANKAAAQEARDFLWGFLRRPARDDERNVALPSPREAVKATRSAGGFAGLDSFARRRPLLAMILW
jgi:hypothetical protein